MTESGVRETLEAFSGACTGCAACAAGCALLSDLDMTPAEIAQAVARGRVDDRLIAAVQRCDLCGACSVNCPTGQSPADLFVVAREALIQTGTVSPSDYDVMLVDRDWHFFTIYRDTYGIRYDDLVADRYDALFFPGCTLASYAPELTRAAHRWLLERGLHVGFSDLCCGKPLESIGLCLDAARHLERLAAQVSAAGAREIITACPNCEAKLRRAGIPGVEVRSLYTLMVAAGMRLSGSETLTFHDSCPDRYDDRNPRDLRSLLSGFPLVEMPSRGKDSICCGSGGIVSTIDPKLSSARAQRRLKEFADSSADACVTSCMACSHRLARGGAAGHVRHCLEYVFGITVDYAQVARNTRLMWEGPQGRINTQRIAAALVPPHTASGAGPHA
jgi:Fe-S oxidoreductase